MNWNDVPTIKDRVPHHAAKFTHEQVRYIREQLAQGVKQDALAHEFNVSHSTISKIKLGKSFRRVL